MKISYYGYSIKRHSDGERFLFDIRPFIRAFVALNDVNFKNRFSHAGESVYLLPIQNGLFLYLMTRSNEIIRKIRSSDHSVSEITDMLRKDEHLGFASYVYFERSFIGFASTIMAPKAISFSNFVNNVIEAIGLNNCKFVLHPLMQETSFADALAMPFIGRSSVQVSKENRFFEDLRNLFQGTAEEFEDVDSFEIVIKPRRRQNIEAAVKKMINTIPHDGLDRFVCSAKEDLGDHLMDFYLAGQGIVSDLVTKGSDLEIYKAVVAKVEANALLAKKVGEHEAHEAFTTEEPSPFSGLHDPNAWANRILDL